MYGDWEMPGKRRSQNLEKGKGQFHLGRLKGRKWTSGTDWGGVTNYPSYETRTQAKIMAEHRGRVTARARVPNGGELWGPTIGLQKSEWKKE